MEEATGDAAAPEGAAAQAAAVPQPMPMPMATPSPRGGTEATRVDSTEGVGGSVVRRTSGCSNSGSERQGPSHPRRLPSRQQMALHPISGLGIKKAAASNGCVAMPTSTAPYS